MNTTPAAINRTSLISEWFTIWSRLPRIARLPSSQQSLHADANQDKTDLGYGGAGQRPFQVHRKQSQQRPCKHGQDAQEQNERTPSHIKLQKAAADHQDTENPRLGKNPRKQRGSRRRSYRMGLGKPDVKREYTGLGAEAKQQTGCPDKRFR